MLGLAMAVFTFVVKCTSGTWTAKQTGGQSSLEDSASNTWELQRKLTNLALTAAGSGVVSSSFSFVTPSSAVAQVSPSSFDRRDSLLLFWFRVFIRIVSDAGGVCWFLEACGDGIRCFCCCW